MEVLSLVVGMNVSLVLAYTVLGHSRESASSKSVGDNDCYEVVWTWYSSCVTVPVSEIVGSR